MKSILNPKWIFLTNTLPLIIILSIYIGEYSIFKSLLKDESLNLWKFFGIALFLLGFLTFIFAFYLIKKRKQVTWVFGLLSLIAYTGFLYAYGYKIDHLIPFSIPGWMEPHNVVLYTGTFLMPTLAYSLFVLVVHLTPEEKEHRAYKNFVAALAIPASLYLFVQLILPLRRAVDSEFTIHGCIIIIISLTLLFLFFLARGVYAIALKKSGAWMKYQLIWKILLTIIFPLLGLAVNNGLLFNEGAFNKGVFGDFSSIWFYILAIVNGVLICLSGIQNPTLRLITFIGRCITFSFTLYFFLVFLPFLPLSVIAIVAIGTGLLMLAPLVVFIIHALELNKDFQFLSLYFPKRLIGSAGILGILFIPGIITFVFINDKMVLNESLDYVYNPDYSKQYSLDKNSLSKTLNVVKDHKEGGRGDIVFAGKLPYISSYFNWLVLDNLTLSDSKINTIEKVIWGKTSFDLRGDDIRDQGVKITNLKSESKYDKRQDAWISWINLEITNTNKEGWNAEYATTLQLPTGCWISDYYLYIGERKEMGLLAEKKSAMWVFNQIRNTNRDPGILYYLSGNKVAFRVFPFDNEEVRKTGLELIHKDPVTINIDGRIVTLGKSGYNKDSIKATESIDKNLIYVPSKLKSKLKMVQRKPYYHFIVDVSEGTENYKNEYIQRISKLLDAGHIDTVNAKLDFVNTYSSINSFSKDWKERVSEHICEGGFYLDKAIRTSLFETYKNQKDSFPIFVIVTDSLGKAVIHKDFSDLKMAFPESDQFYSLNEFGELIPHSLISNPKEPLLEGKSFNFNTGVREYLTGDSSYYYLPDTKEPDIIIKKGIFDVQESDIKEKNWNSAFLLEGVWRSQILHPEKKEEVWVDLVKNSFRTKIMSPVTSYLVVENEVQKEVLKRKQKEALAGKEALDLDDDAQKMSEPELLFLILGLAFVIWLLSRKKFKSAFN